MAKILIVDDDPVIREMLSLTLTDEGHETIVAGNGNEALTTIETTTPDLIITDIIMPEKEGLQLIRELRKKNKDIKIIAMSGGTPMMDGEQLLQISTMFGANRSFTKPVERIELVAAINELLN
jgi:CheY-like chemotaxis protein